MTNSIYNGRIRQNQGGTHPTQHEQKRSETMTQYTIKDGTRANAIEIYFTGKPEQATRDVLKSYKMRWNGQKLCWYGFVTAEEITAAMENGTKKETTPKASKEVYTVNSEEFSTVIADGYLGAYETTGSKYKRGYLFGAELSKAIREDLKKCGFKGVSVSCKTFSGGQEIHLKVKASAEDITSEDEYINNFDINMLNYWIKDLNNNEMYINDLWRMPNEQINQIKDHNAKIQYDYAIDSLNSSGIDMYNYRENPMFTKAFNDKIKALQKVLDAYNHDDSNSMVDYFDRHFYETITVYAE